MRRALSLLVSMSWLLNACTSWQAEQVAPATYIESQHPGQVRLTLLDSTRLELEGPVVEGDSIRGREPGQGADSPGMRAVAQGEVRSLEVRHPDSGKSVLLGVGVVAGAAAVFLGGFALMAANCDFGCN
jgi:hypothetical protein